MYKIFKLISMLQIIAYSQGIEKTANLFFILKDCHSGDTFTIQVKSQGMEGLCTIPMIEIGNIFISVFYSSIRIEQIFC